MLMRDGVTATDETRPGALAREGGSDLGARACARCGVRFRRTPVRWLTCQSCYLANSEVDHLASRAKLSPFRTRPARLGHES
jgi:hypothetical protein